MKVREQDTRKFKQMLKDSGFVLERITGGHEVWKSEEGKTFSIPTHSKTVKSGIVWQFQREYCNA